MNSDPEEVWPEHDGSGPDVSNLGNERETEPDEDEQAAIDCDPNTDTDTDDLNHRYDPVD